MALNDAVPSTATDVFNRNVQDIDRIVNETANVTTRTGRVMESFPMSTERATTEADRAEAAQVGVTAAKDAAAASASTATAKANDAAGSSLTAEQAAQTALATGNYAGQWSTLSGAYSAGISVEHSNIFYALRSNTANIATIEPGVSAEWIAINGANLGTAATKDFATNAQALAGTAGVLPDAAGVHAAFKQYGWGGTDSPPTINLADDKVTNTRVFKTGPTTYGMTISPSQATVFGYFHTVDQPSKDVTFGVTNGTSNVGARLVWSVKVRHTGNTTVDGNGFIKEASPIVKLHSDRIEKNGDFAADFEKIGTGHYVVKNTIGLAQEGWYIETPKDANGNVKVFVEYTDNDGDITVKTYEPDYSTGRAAAGVAVDIPVDRWVDIRLHELPTEPADEEVEE